MPATIKSGQMIKAHGGASMTKSIPLTQGKFALVDDEDFEYLNQFKWTIIKRTYAGRRDGILMHRVIMNTPSGMETDHINGDGFDNRKINLRICTRAENGRNMKKRKDGSSRFKGVCWDKSRGTWNARVQEKFIGRFFDEENAALAYDKKARELFGEFARTNFQETK